MSEGFNLELPVYTPREVARIYSNLVRSVSYATVLQWLQLYRVTDGDDGIDAKKTPGGHYLITADELERVLLKAGAKKARDHGRGTTEAGSDAA